MLGLTRSLHFRASAEPEAGSRRRLDRAGFLLALGASALPGACVGSSSTVDTTSGTGVLTEDAQGDGFPDDAHAEGLASSLHLGTLSYGRLVDLYSLEEGQEPVLRLQDVVVGEQLGLEPGDFRLERDPLTACERLVITHPFESEAYRSAFRDSGPLERLDAGLVRLEDAGELAGGALPALPRNAALVLQFDDLLDECSLEGDSVRLLTGVEGREPFEARVFLDAQHARRDREGGLHSTRIVIDTSVSELEALASERPLEPCPVGLPACESLDRPNLFLRLATRSAPGAGVLRNRAGGALVAEGSGTIDRACSTRDVLRALRTGGPGSLTGDANMGFLADTSPPVVVGSQLVTVLDAPQPNAAGGPRDFILPRLSFLAGMCAMDVARGDLLVQPGFVSQVSSNAAPTLGGLAVNLRVRLLAGDPLAFAASGAGSGQYRAPFQAGVDVPECFVTIDPTPLGYPLQPTVGVSTDASFQLRFSEPMDVASLDPYDALVLSRVAIPRRGTDFVVGSVRAFGDSMRFRFLPTTALAHRAGQAESYFLGLFAGELGPRDLAGNALATSLVGIECRLDPLEAEATTGGRVLRFARVDEEAPFGDAISGPLPEWTGQHSHDLVAQVLRPRALVHFEAVADRTQALGGAMTPLPSGVQTPLNPLGAKLQTLVRAGDVGMRLDESANYNLDVEGLNWAPVGGAVVSDSYVAFEIRLGHGSKLPDELLSPASLFPQWPNSGVLQTYDQNLFGAASQVVHPRERGYTVSPGDLFSSSTGTLMMPFPMNVGLPLDQQRRFTWRDTAILERGAPDGSGGEPDQLALLLGEPILPPSQKLFDTNEVKSVGLPLLLEFRTWADPAAIGLNAFDVSLAVNSSARPYFRAYSAGGINQSNQLVIVDPDLETQANGGFDPFSNPPGQATYGRDPVSYVGSMDLVTRVSRSYSTWFAAVDAAGLGLADPEYVEARVLPAGGSLPPGTEVRLEFRAATSIQNVEALGDALSLDFYGDHYDRLALPLTHNSDDANLGIQFLGGEDYWKSDLTQLDGASYYQMRLTFVSNVASAAAPAVSAVALCWQD